MARALAALTPGRAAAVAAALVALVGAVALNRDLIGVFYDDGLYAGLALALARGLGYVHPHLPGMPAAVHYPPLYPLVLAPLFGMFSVSTAGLLAKLLNLALNAITAGLVTWHATRTDLLGPRAATSVAAALVTAAALAIPMLAMQAVLFSEPLFGFLVAMAVILADVPPARLSSVAGAGLAGLAAALALLTRSIGVAVGAGIVLFLVERRSVSWRGLALAAAPLTLAAGGWGLWVSRHYRLIDPAMALNYGSYAEVVQQAGFGASWSTLSHVLRPLGDLFLSWLPLRPLYFLCAALTVAVSLYGLARVMRRSAIGWSLLLYFAILAVWPYASDRFLWIMLPWIVLIGASGGVALWRHRPLHVPLTLLAVVVTFGWAQVEARGFAGRWWGTTAHGISANFADLLPWVASLPGGAVLATDDEALVWLYTGRTSVPFYVYGYRGATPTTPTPAEQRAYLERQGVTHVLLSGRGSGSDEELDALLGAYPRWLAVVHAWPGGRAAFEVRRER
ncbi:MAG: hypothetical protein AUH06_11745 [Gemmatimonadetes bacterium 13_2_20CM_69_27]|nr:MAG: hypothetical protein AUH06_11745 [Gemmatimonadetes bacterium 13_2_20CM_69_27]